MRLTQLEFLCENVRSILADELDVSVDSEVVHDAPLNICRYNQVETLDRIVINLNGRNTVDLIFVDQKKGEK